MKPGEAKAGDVVENIKTGLRLGTVTAAPGRHRVEIRADDGRELLAHPSELRLASVTDNF